MDNESIWLSIGKTLLSLFMKKEVAVEIPLDKPKEEAKPVVQNAPKLDPVSDFLLIHNRFCPDGIFGELKTGDGKFVAYTLEHSYDNKPKLADGNYTCVKGPHRLHGMTEDFTTYEIKGIPDFDGKPVTGVLFHWGNYNKDSEGCVLLGSSQTPTMVVHSRDTWASFMTYLAGRDSFTLTVISS